MQHALFQDTEAKVVWDQTAFDAFMAKRDPAQEAADQKRLKMLFDAASAPASREAFDWAHANGVRFFIDRSLQHAGAYYTMGTGVVALGGSYTSNPAIAIPLLVHEIRHAWQDKQGMIPTTARNFAEYMIQIALIEADASAWQHASARHETASWYYEEGMKSPELPPREVMMGSEFNRWHIAHGKFYGEAAARGMGSKLEIPGVTPLNIKAQFRPYTKQNPAPDIRGIDTALDAVIAKLGRGFDPANTDLPNYLEQPQVRAHLEKTLLRPRLAHRFFEAAAKVPPLVKDVNKAMIRKQQQHRRKTGSDLYI